MDILTLLQTLVAIALVVVILMQNRGAGLGSVFGGSGNTFSTKRGVEKILFRATIILAIIFIVLALANILT